MRLLVTCLFLVGCSAHLVAQVFINEILAENKAAVFDPVSEKFPDFIELYNSDQEPSDLSGYGLSDDPAQPFQWIFPEGTVIDGLSTLVVWADGSNLPMHSNFRLNKNGETVCLSSPKGAIIDQVSYGTQFQNYSYGLQPDGGTDFHYFCSPSPGKRNTAQVCRTAPESVSANLASGFYTTSQSLKLTAGEGCDIFYTLDGREPTRNDLPYGQPIAIDSTAIVKAIAVNGYGESTVLVRSIFINERDFDLPVISLTTDPDNFFSDETGIYVVGTNGATGHCMDIPVNWNQDWERPVSFEYFGADGNFVLQKNASARIMGGCSRIRSQKSLTIVAKDGRFDYPFFKNRKAQSYNSIVLRNSGNDWGEDFVKGGPFTPGTMLADGFMQYLVKDEMDVDYQEYQPSVVFLNGKYWGIHNIREHLNDKYLNNLYPDVNGGNIDLLKNYFDVKDGDNVAYSDMMAFVGENDLSDSANYAHIESMLDIDEYINYMIAQLYFANYDWPGKNIRMWRKRSETGKWRFILFDTDFGFGRHWESPETNSFDVALDPNGPNWPNPPHSTLLLRKLIENDEFKTRIIQQFLVMIGTTFQPSRVDNILYTLRDSIAGEMPYHLDRWYVINNTPEMWRQTVDSISAWGAERPEKMIAILQEQFSLSNPAEFHVKTDKKQSGYLTVAHKKIDTDEATLMAFPDLLVNCSVTPADGYLFSHWEDAHGNHISQSPKMDVAIQQGDTIVAVMVEREQISGLYINEVLAQNSGLIWSDNGKTPDYVELYNTTDKPVDLSGLYISDDPAMVEKFQLPYNAPELTIPAQGFLVLWADAKREIGAHHIGWKLAKEGGSVILSAKINGSLVPISQIEYPELDKNYSYGRIGSELAEMYPTASTENSDLTEIARLFSLETNSLPLKPTFHPEVLDYRIAIPEGFSKDFDVLANAYGNADVNISSLDSDGVITIHVTSEDDSAETDYTISVNDYQDISNKLSDISVVGGVLLQAFDPDVLFYRILVDANAVPELDWTKESRAADVAYTKAQSQEGKSRLVVSSEVHGEREYSFSFTNDEYWLTGFTEPFSTEDSIADIPESSFTGRIQDDALALTINKTAEWDGVSLKFSGNTLDLTDVPFLQICISSDTACQLRIDLSDANGVSTNGPAVTHDVVAGEQQIITYDYTGGFFQTWPENADVDPLQITGAWLCFDPGLNGLKAQVSIDYIKVGDHVVFAPEIVADPMVHVSEGSMYPNFDAEIFNYYIADYREIPALFASASGANADVDIQQFTKTESEAKVTVSQRGLDNRTYTFSLVPLNDDRSSALLTNVVADNGTLSPVFYPSSYQYTIDEFTSELSDLDVSSGSFVQDLRVYKAPDRFQDSYIIVHAYDGEKLVYRFAHNIPGISVDEDPDASELPHATSLETAIELAAVTNALLYPNPSNGQFYYNGTQTATITIFGISGNVLCQFINIEPHSFLQVPDALSGTFTVYVETLERSETMILILNR